MSMKKRTISILCTAVLALSLASCGTTEETQTTTEPTASPSESASSTERVISLSDDEITLDGETIAEDDAGDVTVSHDIVYYEAGMGSDYGEGTEADEHSAEEAEAHTVVTIRSAGTYRLTGTLSQSQIAVDLGDEAKDDPDAVVTLILDNVDVTCTVAPALIFYNVYECADGDEETASSDVDTTAAGANVIIADDSVNNFNGSYVARIYETGTTDKLHKYDGAFYSKMSMNIDGEADGTGVLNIVAENEGLGTEMHLTINGGTVTALGNMFGTVSADSAQDYLTLTLTNAVDAGSEVVLSDADGNELFSFTAPKAASMLLLSSADISSDADYTLTVGGTEVEYSTDIMSDGPGGGGLGGEQMNVPEGLEDWLSTATDIPDDIRTWLESLIEMQNNMPDGQTPPDNAGETPPEGEQPPEEEQPSETGNA